MKTWIWFLTAAFCLLLLSSSLAKKVFECEVCIGVLTKFSNTLTGEEKTTPLKIDEKFKAYCASAKGKDQRFCYYLGGLPDSATYILGEMSKPLSWGLPPEKVCEKLSKLDSQICELKYEKTIDLNTVDLSKLKVKDLKKILNGWDEDCKGCAEKSDFIKKIEELKPKYSRTEL